MPRSLAILLFCAFALVTGEYFDMSEGDPGMESPCPPGQPLTGTWTEEDVSNYPDPPEGPLEGKVLKSQFKTKSCIRTPQLFEVNDDESFQLYVYLPEATIGTNTRKLLVWLVEEDDGSYLITELRGPSEAKWHLINVPVPLDPGIIYPNNFKV